MVKRTVKKTLIVETKYGSFRCVFEPEKDMGGYVVEACGVPGAISCGKTLSEAKQMITEAIEGAVEANIVAQAEKKGIVRIKNGRHFVSIA
ncbi:MAG: type II toxin-antitoxin system HicB family antitoxin [bacterium]|nr:type II toxin-antitoxin system HicB family antitoxin [bacterium]